MFKAVLYFKLESLTATKLAPFFRRRGQALFRQGQTLQGELGHDDYLVPSTRCIPISDSKYPKLLDAEWIAPNATVVGDVTLGPGSSLWHGVIARGDTTPIEIGKNTIVQDLARLGSNTRSAGEKIVIGDNVYIGPNAKLETCNIESFAYIGMGASIGKGVTIESFAVIASGAVIPDGATVPSGQVWAGTPAKYLRDLTQEEKHLISEHHLEMQQLSQIYCEETEKNFRQIVEHTDALIKYQRQDPVDKALDIVSGYGLPMTGDDLEYLEHRVYHDYVGTVDYDIKDPAHEPDEHLKAWIPYEQDMTQYPEVFKVYQENYKRFDELENRFKNQKPFQEAPDQPFARKLPKDMSPWEKKYDDLMPKYTGTLCQ